MFAKKLLLYFIAFGWIISLTPPIAAKDYKIGTVFRDLLEIDYPAAKKSAPLPPGDWKLVSRFEFRTDHSNIPIVHYYLLRLDGKTITGIATVVTHKEFVNFRWRETRVCSKDRRSRAWYSEFESYDGFEDCNILYPLRRLNRKFKPARETFDYIDSNRLSLPRQNMFIRFVRTRNDEMFHVHYLLSLDHFGFSTQSSSRDWETSRIEAFPEKEAFMKGAIKWTKSWKKLIDKGFKNELRRANITAHFQIAKRTPAKAPEAPDALSYPVNRYLTAQQVKELYTGAEFESRTTRGEIARARYNADGTYHVDIAGRTMTGKWRVKKSGEYCFENDKGGSGCWLTKYLGRKIFQNLNAQGRTRVQTLIRKGG